MTSELVALSVLALDYPMPAAGWAVELDGRGVGIVLDDLGRPAIPRAVARDLLAERRANEERKAQRLKEIEAAAIEADQRFRARLGQGFPEAPNGMTPAAWAMALDREGDRRRRRSVLQDALEGTGTIYHPVGGES